MGRPVPGTDILLLGEDGRPVGPNVVGEIVHRGPSIASGYWDDPDATRRTFRPNPLRPAEAPDTERVVFTGDLAKKDRDGFLHFVGRRDRMIKSMGFRVGPDEVVDVLYASGEVREAVVDAEPDPIRGDRIVAYVVLRDEGSLGRLERFCRSELPAFAHPSRYVPLSALPRLPSGKYDVDALRHSDPDSVDRPDPRTTTPAPSSRRDPVNHPQENPMGNPGHQRPRAGLHFAGET
jgi:acyl-CoA synthetase (AMP-forming)/AMP-acid ligase II